ncbi:metallophosphoesterase family protein [Xanthovirga aplysinae]|uniref:metallophosphoesterase family protein n=1 Tax=Xanthovirga aplysinae TaxID=2529853 RepID=UPI0012BC494B|nr:metallophosphoesterase family protein [Xanthovirga aplysinae]MTI32745.1 metallophosphoesterase [Xanthovirga aplysinae]
MDLQIKPKVKDLGNLSGEVLVFGGVYSNFQALEAFYQIAKERGVPAENIICTGDVVGYCAQPEECLQLVKSWGIHCIAGNVELQLGSNAEDCGCDFRDGSRCHTFSKQWYPYAVSQLSKSSLEWIQTLTDHIRFTLGGKTCYVVHGSYGKVSEYIFASTNWEVKKKVFEESRSEVILSGHSGLPFSEERGRKMWVNSGAIGMPANDSTPRVWYLLLSDLDKGLSFNHHHFDYDHFKASELMLEKKLPQAYAKTLLTGLWDNCEILPEKETKQQGVSLCF